MRERNYKTRYTRTHHSTRVILWHSTQIATLLVPHHSKEILDSSCQAPRSFSLPEFSVARRFSRVSSICPPRDQPCSFTQSTASPFHILSVGQQWGSRTWPSTLGAHANVGMVNPVAPLTLWPAVPYVLAARTHELSMLATHDASVLALWILWRLCWLR